ncbi:S41 family peptidase [Longispora albida]|uniref:S41 family peptidase n=1 Tax=Longispora albida TaxID=203523 RepID=UPI0003766FB8|nr:S41 family peptidase [Longispora albida]
MTRELVTGALEFLRTKYIFPDKAAAAAAAISARLDAGEYDGLTEDELGERLTSQLYDLCADKHLRVRTREEDLQEAMTEAEATALWHEHTRIDNYRIHRVERLAGNVGLIDLRGIADPVVAAPAFAAAMELVRHTDALIFDLRKNRGGSPEGVQYWNSFLFPDAETHLNDIFDAGTGLTRQYWTLPHLPVARYVGKPVYVLTSSFTFSAGEEFAYNLQAQKRATLIGEVTKGGAHPTDAFPITPTFEITVPTARSINPVTGTNWEGTGVHPDIAVPADQALDLAYQKCLEHVVTTATAESVREEARAAAGAS